MEPTDVERLKRDWTGKRVTVTGEIPRLRRFRGVSGSVITLNMNGRALVQFDGSADIGWYDVALSDLAVTTAPPAAEESAPSLPSATAATTPEIHPPGDSTPKPTPAKGMSILELARRQGAVKRTGVDE